MFQKLNEVQNYALLYLSLINLCSEVPLDCVFVRNIRMVMDHVNFLMIRLWVWNKNQCHTCDLKTQFLRPRKMNVMITGIFWVLGSGSQDPFWLIKIIKNNCIANSEDPDSYGNIITPGQRKLKGYFWERMHRDKNFSLYNIVSYVTFYHSLNYSFLILF